MDSQNQTAMQNMGIPQIISLIEKGARKLRVIQLPGSSASYLAVLINKELERPVLIITEDEKNAQKTNLQVGFFKSGLGLSMPSFHLPSRDIFKTLPVSEGGHRSAALCAMISAGKRSPVAVSASISALLLRTAPPEIFTDFMIEVCVGDTVDRDKLIEDMVFTGYTSVSSVMEPGDFSVRGEYWMSSPRAPDIPPESNYGTTT